MTKKTKGPSHFLRFHIGGVILLVALFAAGSALGAKLYRYRNESGTLSFSDRPPAGNIETEVRRLKVGEPPGRVALRNLGTDRNPVLQAVNDHFFLIDGLDLSVQPAVAHGIQQPAKERRRLQPQALEILAVHHGLDMPQFSLVAP